MPVLSSRFPDAGFSSSEGFTNHKQKGMMLSQKASISWVICKYSCPSHSVGNPRDPRTVDAAFLTRFKRL